ncbi:hypothetical protein GTX53_12985 [Streptomyces sp. SID5594]|uniref:hypothetical protein n=1 Tax=unclassified Streptomyces TaxID=2593676 RepID=UPI000376B05E|nr:MULTISPECIES: hypothetical protein [unclassified Streptomyces]MZF54748.1 hypothetical protein [Streptomyces sp. SID5594]
MPATVIDDPLGVSCVFMDGRKAQCFLNDGRLPQLAVQLVRALADLVKPHGDLDSPDSVRGYLVSIRFFLRDLEKHGFTGAAQDLSRPVLARALLALKQGRHESPVRLLRRLDDLEGVFAADVRRFVDGRNFHARAAEDRNPLVPYSEREWANLISVCEGITGRAYTAFKAALREAGLGQDVAVGGWSRQNVQWMLRQRGPEGTLPRRVRGQYAAVRRLTKVYPGADNEAVAALFPGPGVVFAYRILFGTRTGIVADGIAGLGLGDIDWAGDRTALVAYIKGRTAQESLTLSRSAVRLLERWLEHSSVLREFAPADLRGRLWLRFNPTGTYKWSAGRFPKPDEWNRYERNGLVDAEGRPFLIHGPRIRTTFEASKDRRIWQSTSRARIDPNHTPAVEGAHYVAHQTPTQKAATEAIIESAQGDLIRRSQNPLVIKGDDGLAAFLDGFPAEAARLGLDDAALAELIGGERDVFAAACGDQLSGLHGPPGKPCPARPWVCLLCPLALFAPRHLPNLMRLRAFFARQWQQTPAAAFMAFFARQWQQTPAAAFMAIFGLYAHRLDDLLSPESEYFTAAALQDAAGQVADADRELPLRPEEMTW